MEEYNADSFFDQVVPSHYFAQGSALIPDPTNETTAPFNAPQHTLSYPAITSHNDSLGLLSGGLDLYGNGFIEPFDFSTGMI
jgi:hypothetical protein